MYHDITFTVVYTYNFGGDSLENSGAIFPTVAHSVTLGESRPQFKHTDRVGNALLLTVMLTTLLHYIEMQISHKNET
jgi:hypothetical protein